MKKALVFLLCFFLLPMGGCWDMAEINERTFVLAMGIDKADEEELCKYIFHCASPSGESSDVTSNQMSYVNIVVTAPALAPAISEMIRSCDHNVSFEHLQVLALGGRYAKESDLHDLDSLFRIASVRRKCSVVIADSELEKLLTERGGDDSAEKIRQLVAQYYSDSLRTAGDFSLQELFSRRKSELSFYLPLVNIISSSDLGAAMPGSASSENTEPIFIVNGVCAFDSGRYSGCLGIPELETMRLLGNRQTQGMIASAKNGKRELHYQIISSRCRCSCSVKSGVPEFEIELKMECMLLEHGDSFGESAAPVIENDVRERIERLITLSRGRYGAEIAGLETAARQNCALWFNASRKEWKKLYEQAEISVNVQCTAASDGFIK